MGPLGTNKLDKMLHFLCKVVNKPGFGNASVGATGIQLLKSAGFNEEIIKMFSGPNGNILNQNLDSTYESMKQQVRFSEIYKVFGKTRPQIKNSWHGNIRCAEIPQDTLQAIFELLSDVQALMKSRLEQKILSAMSSSSIVS